MHTKKSQFFIPVSVVTLLQERALSSIRYLGNQTSPKYGNTTYFKIITVIDNVAADEILFVNNIFIVLAFAVLILQLLSSF